MDYQLYEPDLMQRTTLIFLSLYCGYCYNLQEYQDNLIMVKIQPTKFQAVCLKGFVKLKKIQKFEKNSRVDGRVGQAPTRILLFFWKLCVFCVFCSVGFCCTCFKNKLERGEGGWGLSNPRFFWIFGFFLT